MLTCPGLAIPASFVGWLVRTRRALLADDVGLGKTIEAIVTILHLKEQGEMWGAPARVIWVTEPALIEPTKAKIVRFAPSLTVLTQLDKEGKMDAKAQIALRSNFDGWDIYIVGYDFLTSRRQGFAKLFRNPSMFVLDETMGLKGAGVRQEAIRDLTHPAPRVLAMTATPYENDPMETFAVLRAMDAPNLWATGVFKTFVEWAPGYQLPTGGWVEEKPLGWHPDGLSVVREYLETLMLRRNAEDAGLRLPQQVGESIRWVPPTAQQSAAYKAATKLTGLSRHRAREKAGRIAGDSSCLVDECLRELARRSGEKVIVYCESLDVLGLLAKRLEECGLDHRVLEGRIKPHERDQFIEDFCNDPDVNVLVGSSVLERGLDLQFARVLISLDSSYNPQREHQREGRVCRIGSPHESYEHLTLLPDTPLTQEKLAALERKGENATVLGIGR
jgi:SNF2 family DNA or RNA helicase